LPGIAVTIRIAVYTTRAGQTSTYWATSLAWTLAERRRVMLIDCDMEGGTIADLLYLEIDDRSLGNCFGDRPARTQDLEEQATPVARRPLLRVIPGMRSSCGMPISESLRQLRPALDGLEDDVVVVDLGHPLAHAGLRSPRTAAESICSVFSRGFIVIRDEPALIARSINVLRSARPSHGEIILCRQRSRAMTRCVVDSLQREIPELPVREGWPWDQRAAARMGDGGMPMVLPGVERALAL
jgi:MinD-like ATPase involved in chromosome partitioning or flagellar assembly